MSIFFYKGMSWKLFCKHINYKEFTLLYHKYKIIGIIIFERDQKAKKKCELVKDLLCII